jgi:hypothetical protein
MNLDPLAATASSSNHMLPAPKRLPSERQHSVFTTPVT